MLETRNSGKEGVVNRGYTANWITVCGLLHKVLELHFHFIAMMSLSRLVLVPVFPVENA